MAQRTYALCNGEYIGIESIFTIKDGKQINIPERLSDLRKKSQSNQLFCPCGKCGANLVLVAGDRNLKEQHFRIKKGHHFSECTYIEEGSISVESKIVLKCWLDDILHDDKLESRVPICDVSDSNRKYEFSFLSRKNGVAVDYCFNRVNLSEEKQSIIDVNSKGINIIHIVDSMNSGTNGQFPESLMRVQEKQGFCLFLNPSKGDYEKAELRVAVYSTDYKGLWVELPIVTSKLSQYTIDKEGLICLFGKRLSVYCDETVNEWNIRNKNELIKINKEKEDLERRKAEKEAQSAIEKSNKNKKIETFKENIVDKLIASKVPIQGPDGNYYFLCSLCGKIGTQDEFPYKSIPGHYCIGACQECNEGALAGCTYTEKLIRIKESFKHNVSMKCPRCGSKLIIRTAKKGINGGRQFYGCSAYPDCKYSQSL